MLRIISRCSQTKLEGDLQWLHSTDDAALEFIDRVKVSHPTRQKIGHSEMFHKPVSWLGMERLNLTQQKHAFTNEKKFTTTPTNKHRKLMPGLFASYDIRPGKGRTEIRYGR